MRADAQARNARTRACRSQLTVTHGIPLPSRPWRSDAPPPPRAGREIIASLRPRRASSRGVSRLIRSAPSLRFERAARDATSVT